jgi:hypothetical protein
VSGIWLARRAWSTAALLNPSNDLPQRFDFPLVPGLLAVGFFE